MEYVPGVPITEFCRRHRQSIRERLQLLQQVCAGVQHAHQKGVVHRDLKPGNILVVGDQETARVKIIDFGLAKSIDVEDASRAGVTLHDQVVGTPEYMAPEQADSRFGTVDTRTDVYSLGVILYELLVGALPFPGLRAEGLAGVQRRICTETPPRPSERFAATGSRWSRQPRSPHRSSSGCWSASRRCPWRARRRDAAPAHARSR